MWDVIVAGGSVAGVAAAESAAAAGAKTILFESRPYLGWDLAGTLRLRAEAHQDWPPSDRFETKLARAIHEAPGDLGVVTPLRLKQICDRRLLNAKIPFRTWTTPCDVVFDASGNFAGVVTATRGGLEIVRGKTLVDATGRAVLARRAGALVTPAERRDPLVGTSTTDSGRRSDTGSDRGFDMDSDTGSDRGFDMDSDTGSDRGARRSAGVPEAPLVCTRGIVDGEKPAFREAKISFADGADDSARAWARREQEARDATWTSNTLDAADMLLPVVAGGDATRTSRLRGEPAPRVRAPWLLSAAQSVNDCVAAGRAAGAASAAEARALPVPGAPVERTISELPILATCDVFVAGAGTAGAPAAIAAARAGAKTIVADPLHRMGGVMTDGLIDSYCFGLRIGFTAELDKGVDALGATVHGVGKAEWLRRAAHAAGAEIWFGATVVGLVLERNAVRGVVVAFADGTLGRVAARCAIDATGNADLAAMAGEETAFITADELSVQGAGSTAKLLGRTYMNTDCGFVDDTDALDLMHFTLRVRQSTGAWAWDQSQVVNSRERRRLHGVAYVTPQDVMLGRTYPDVIARTRSNFDTHGQTVGAQFFIETPHAPQPLTVNLPYRCFLPKRTDGLLVTGLGMSAHRDAMPVLRMQPDVQNQGYVAGWAAAMACKDGVAVRNVDVRKLQKHLIEKGIVDESVLTMKDNLPLADGALAAAAKKMAEGGYAGLAELLTDPARAKPLLKATPGLPAAHVLALLGDGARAAEVAAAVSTNTWDAGWNYRGMDQFGRSVSWVDSYLIALGKAKAKCALEPLLAKMAALTPASEYSHFRAVALCAEGVGDKAAVPALAKLLALPGVGGHAQRPVAEAGVVPIPEYAFWESGNRGIADRERSDCLRELCLARALYNLGDDAAHAGEKTLRAYAEDPRRAYANHAKQVLTK